MSESRDILVNNGMEKLHIRRFMDKDAEATARIFFDAIHLGTEEYYTEIQRYAWAPEPPEVQTWRNRLNSQSSFVALSNDKPIGFMTLMADGCIDLAYVAPPFMGQGVASKLYDAVLSEAATSGMQRLYTEASHPARAFFERQGWAIVTPQTISRNDVDLENFLMEKI